MKKTPKRDCPYCGWGVEWELGFNSRGEERLRGRCCFQPMPKFCGGPWATISAQAEPATDCPAWKKASGPMPPWGVWTDQWRLEMLLKTVREAQEAWDNMPPDMKKEFEAAGIKRP